MSDGETLIYALFNISDSILKKTAQGKKVSECLDRYKKILKRIPLDEHKNFFLSVFEKNKKDILDDKSDQWLRKSTVFVQFNEGSIEVNSKSRILLGNIYEKSIDLRVMAKGAYEISPTKSMMPMSIMFPEVKYPETFQLCLYKLFVYFLSMDNKESFEVKLLKGIIEKIEKTLGFKPAGAPGVPGAAQGPMNPMNLLNDPNALSGIIAQTFSMLENTGFVKPGEEKQGADSITNLFGQLMNNPKVKNIVADIGKVMDPNSSDANKQKDISNIMNTVVGLVNDSGFIPKNEEIPLTQTTSVVSGISELPSLTIEDISGNKEISFD